MIWESKDITYARYINTVLTLYIPRDKLNIIKRKEGKISMMRNNSNYKIIKEGDIWKIKIPKSENGDYVQYSEKYVVVMSNNMNNIYSPNISVITLTSKKRDKRLPVHYTFKAGELEGMWLDTTVLAETYAPIDKKYFIERVGKTTKNQKYIIANLLVRQSPMLSLSCLNNSNNKQNASYSNYK